MGLTVGAGLTGGTGLTDLVRPARINGRTSGLLRESSQLSGSFSEISTFVKMTESAELTDCAGMTAGSERTRTNGRVATQGLDGD